jgi:hypothetical protein
MILADVRGKRLIAALQLGGSPESESRRIGCERRRREQQRDEQTERTLHVELLCRSI